MISDRCGPREGWRHGRRASGTSAEIAYGPGWTAAWTYDDTTVLELVDASGDLVALTGSRSVAGTWSKAGVNEPFQLCTHGGDQLLLSPGNTWVELPAPSAEVTVG